MPAIGDTSTCNHCGESIAWMGSSWGHFGDIQPKHPATPIEAATVTTSDGYIVKTSDKRVVACVNACAGIADPSAIPLAVGFLQVLANRDLSQYDAHARAGLLVDLHIQAARIFAKLKGGA